MKDNAWKMGDEFVKLGRNVWLAGLGAVSLADEETRGAFDKLISRGAAKRVDKPSLNEIYEIDFGIYLEIRPDKV